MWDKLKSLPLPTVILMLGVVAAIVVTLIFAPADRLAMLLSGEGIIGAIVLASMRGLRQ